MPVDDSILTVYLPRRVVECETLRVAEVIHLSSSYPWDLRVRRTSHSSFVAKHASHVIAWGDMIRTDGGSSAIHRNKMKLISNILNMKKNRNIHSYVNENIIL